ncbi:hypothetical protein MJ391_23375 [Escherichia coli]|nr:hypothetical protein MJ391_23375 [Escherichia coli]
MALLKSPAEAIKDPATLPKAGWVVLLLLLAGDFSSWNRSAFR